jgi:hypothetical protein
MKRRDQIRQVIGSRPHLNDATQTPYSRAISFTNEFKSAMDLKFNDIGIKYNQLKIPAVSLGSPRLVGFFYVWSYILHRFEESCMFRKGIISMNNESIRVYPPEISEIAAHMATEFDIFIVGVEDCWLALGESTAGRPWKKAIDYIKELDNPSINDIRDVTIEATRNKPTRLITVGEICNLLEELVKNNFTA